MTTSARRLLVATFLATQLLAGSCVPRAPSISNLTASPNPVRAGIPATVAFTIDYYDSIYAVDWNATLVETPSSGGSLSQTIGVAQPGEATNVNFTYNTRGATSATITVEVRTHGTGKTDDSKSVTIQVQ